jgi:hypothetical protein
VMPSQCPGKESSGGDVESFVPDSSSIADDAVVGVGSTGTVWQTSTLSMTQQDGFKKSMANGAGTQLELSPSYSMDFPQGSPEIKSMAKSANPQTFQNMNLQNNLNAGGSCRSVVRLVFVTVFDQGSHR